jgi:hypothetical protein
VCPYVYLVRMINPPIHLRLPEDLRDAVLEAAQREERTTADMIRLLIKRGLTVPFQTKGTGLIEPERKPTDKAA